MKYPKNNLTKNQKNEVMRFNSSREFAYEDLNCINCDLSNSKKLYDNDRYGILQKTVMCNNCGLVYSNPRMNEESLKDFYSSNLYRELYEKEDNFEHGFILRKEEINKEIVIKKPNFDKYYSQLFIDFIANTNINYNSVCELGAGYGTNLIYFNKLGKKTFGLEPSIKLAEIANKNKINIKQGFIHDLKDTYDIIVLKHVFEHLHDPIKDLKKIKNHTNNYLYLEVPGNVKRIASIQNAHNFYFTENTLNKIVCESGFDIVEIKYCKDNEFILALYRKSQDKTKNFNYNYIHEVKKIKKIYKNDNIRFFISKILKTLKIYNFLIPFRKLALKILRLDN